MFDVHKTFTTTAWSGTLGTPSLPHLSGRAVDNSFPRISTEQRGADPVTTLPER